MGSADVEINLVSLETDEVYSACSDSAWVEDRRDNVESFSAVLAGKYMLVVVPIDRFPWASKAPIHETVKTESPRVSWWLRSVVVMLLWPAIQFTRGMEFENNRWRTSDFSRDGTPENE